MGAGMTPEERKAMDLWLESTGVPASVLSRCLAALDEAKKQRDAYLSTVNSRGMIIEELEQRAMSAEFDKAERDKRIAELKGLMYKLFDGGMERFARFNTEDGVAQQLLGLTPEEYAALRARTA